MVFNLNHILEQQQNFSSEPIQNLYKHHVDLSKKILDFVVLNSRENEFDENQAKRIIEEIYHCSFFNDETEHHSEWKKILEKYPDFLTAPASTKFHGNFEHGLFLHSILTVAYGIKLEAVYGCFGDLRAFLWHDLCKCGMYKKDKKNVKVDGKWVEQSCWVVKSEYKSIQHGPESLLRLLKLGVEFSEEWERAIAFHMGVFSCHENDRVNFVKAGEKCFEVLALQQADTLASQWVGV